MKLLVKSAKKRHVESATDCSRTCNWYGPKTYVGLHYDLHANESDTELGSAKLADLLTQLKIMNPDFAQTDCKGHPGITSWYSKVRGATVAKGIVRDAKKLWRDATNKLGIPLHCHYSGVWDKAAGKKNPGWCIVRADGLPAVGFEKPKEGVVPIGEKMCPRGPYLDKLMIPQMKELIDRYHVDGFWIDGDLWATEPCYCKRCKAAFAAENMGQTPPRDFKDARWPAWMDFTRQSFEAYVTRYCDAIHKHKPGTKICSNWLQTFSHPGAPAVPTDWISGDNSWVFGLDKSRCEARFISTRGKPWDVMLWSFYFSHGLGIADSPQVFKSPQMLMQETAMVLALGGNVQLYEHPQGLRNGALIPWRMKRLKDVAKFVRRRRTLCQGTTTMPQIAVLHSEHHARATLHGPNQMWDLDVAPVRGAVYSLLENHYNVDILDEWAMTTRINDFPVIVAPEQDLLSDAMVASLRDYVTSGGRLLVTGSAAYDRFGSEFLGVRSDEVREKCTFFVPADDGNGPIYSAQWRLVTPLGARKILSLGTTGLSDARLLPNPSLTVYQVGKGRVAYVPAAVFREFDRDRYPQTRLFINQCITALGANFPVEIKAPTCIDVVLRQKGNTIIIVNLINRTSGLPNAPGCGAVDEIPYVGPVEIILDQSLHVRGPIKLAFEKSPMKTRISNSGQFIIMLDRVQIHCALEISIASVLHSRQRLESC